MIVIDALKAKVTIIINKLQVVMGFIELEQYDKAHEAAVLAVNELRSLAKMLSGLTVAITPDVKAVLVPTPISMLPVEDVLKTVDVTQQDKEALEALPTGGVVAVVPVEHLTQLGNVTAMKKKV